MRHGKVWIGVAVAVLAAVVAVLLLTSGGGQEPATVDVTVNKQAGDGLPTKTVAVPERAVEQARGDFTHNGLDDRPENVPPPSDQDVLKAAKVQTQVKPLPTAGAVQGFGGCVTRILPVNYSSRNGARATWQVLHYTVSANRPGWSDVNAIVALFSNSARQASSNFVVDSEGNCAYIVPIESKAWTQAGGNPWSISYEVVASGSEPRYLEPPGLAKLKSVMQQVAKRTAIPLTRGAVSGSCTPVRAGIVQHKDFGLCGGGHVDITPFSIDGVLAALDLGSTATLTAKERKLVRSARAPKKTGHSRRYWCDRVSAQIVWLGHSPKVERRGARVKILKRVRGKTCR